MGNKFLRLFLIVISSFAASVGLASCGNTYTPSYDNLSFTVISEEEKICEVNGYKKYYNDERDNNIYIPKMWNDYKVTSVGESAFLCCTTLSSIEIPDSVTSIGDYAFDCCYSLSSIEIPDSVTLIGKSAFYNCTSLSSIVISDSVTSICEFAFYCCKSLSDVYYIGSEEQWNAISIGKSNSDLYSATIHYNYIGK